MGPSTVVVYSMDSMGRRNFDGNKLLKLNMRQTLWRRNEDSETFSFVGHVLPTLLFAGRYDHL